MFNSRLFIQMFNTWTIFTLMFNISLVKCVITLMSNSTLGQRMFQQCHRFIQCHAAEKKNNLSGRARDLHQRPIPTVGPRAHWMRNEKLMPNDTWTGVSSRGGDAVRLTAHSERPGIVLGSGAFCFCAVLGVKLLIKEGKTWQLKAGIRFKSCQWKVFDFFVVIARLDFLLIKQFSVLHFLWSKVELTYIF